MTQTLLEKYVLKESNSNQKMNSSEPSVSEVVIKTFSDKLSDSDRMKNSTGA